MGSRERRELTQEMLDRIDNIVGGNELQRSPEAHARWIPRIHDGPLRFDDERTADAPLVASGGLCSGPGLWDNEFLRVAFSEDEYRTVRGFLAPAMRNAEVIERSAAALRGMTSRGGASFETIQRSLRAHAAQIEREARQRQPLRFGVDVATDGFVVTAVEVRPIVIDPGPFHAIGEILTNYGRALLAAFRQFLTIVPHLNTERPSLPVPAKRNKHRYGR